MNDMNVIKHCRFREDILQITQHCKNRPSLVGDIYSIFGDIGLRDVCNNLNDIWWSPKVIQTIVF